MRGRMGPGEKADLNQGVAGGATGRGQARVNGSRLPSTPPSGARCDREITAMSRDTTFTARFAPGQSAVTIGGPSNTTYTDNSTVLSLPPSTTVRITAVTFTDYGKVLYDIAFGDQRVERVDSLDLYPPPDARDHDVQAKIAKRQARDASRGKETKA